MLPLLMLVMLMVLLVTRMKLTIVVLKGGLTEHLHHDV